jgi:hypothetical protein
MDELRLRSRTVSELVDAAFALYRRDANQYIVMMAVATLPQLVARLVLRGDGTPSLNTALLGLAVALVSLFTYTIGTAAITKFGSRVYLGEQADLEETVRSVIPKVGELLWAGILKGLLYIVGFMVFFLGEFYVAARFFAVGAAIVLEDSGVDEAFSRSSKLSAGRKRHILNTLLLVWIIYFLLSFCVSFVANLTKSTVADVVFSTAFTIVAYPVIGLTSMLLYYDCRIRGEGFDIERMAASMAATGVSPGAAGAAS